MGKSTKTESGETLKARNEAKKQARLDSHFARIEVQGLEGLNAIREAQPEASPLEAKKLLEEAFIEAFSSTEGHFERVGAIEEYVATSIFIHGLDDTNLDVIRDCVAFIESTSKSMLLKRNMGKAGKFVLKAAEIGVWFIPGGGAAKSAQIGAKAVVSLLIRHREKVVKGVALAVDAVNNKSKPKASDLKRINAARKIIEELKTHLGPVPKAWPKG